MKLPIHTLCLATTAVLLLGGQSAMAADKDSAKLIPLQMYWNFDRTDHFNFCSPQGQKDAEDDNYEFLRTEAYVFATAQAGTVPLKLYWKPDRHEHDYFLAATPQAEKDAKTAGYQFVRIEGYVYDTPQPGTVPLRHYWKGNDNLLTATKQGERDAIAEDYLFVRVEGYAIRDSQAFLGNQTIEYVPLILQRRGLQGKEVVLDDDDRMVTPMSFNPPVEITIVAKTDSTNLRIGYAADQIIFNWERDPRQLRVNGGPADGKHNPGAGLLPTGKYVTLKWIVTSHQQSLYADGHLRFMDVGDYSDIDRPVSVFPAVHSRVTVKSLKVKRLSPEAANEADTTEILPTIK